MDKMRFVLLLLALAGCYREDRDYATQGNPPKTTTTPAQATATATSPEGVELMEYSIRMPAVLAAGKHTFHVVNAGKEKHGVEIEGKGVEVGLPDSLTAGNQTTWDVSLPPGTYEVYCPVDDHKEKGMKTTVVVR